MQMNSERLRIRSEEMNGKIEGFQRKSEDEGGTGNNNSKWIIDAIQQIVSTNSI